MHCNFSITGDADLEPRSTLCGRVRPSSTNSTGFTQTVDLFIRRRFWLAVLLLPLCTGCAVVPGPYGIPKVMALRDVNTSPTQPATQQPTIIQTASHQTTAHQPTVQQAVVHQTVAQQPTEQHTAVNHQAVYHQQVPARRASVRRPTVGVPTEVVDCPYAAAEARQQASVEANVVSAPAQQQQNSAATVTEWVQAKRQTHPAAPRIPAPEVDNTIQQVSAQFSQLAIPEPPVTEASPKQVTQLFEPPTQQQTVLMPTPPCDTCEQTCPPPKVHTDQIEALLKRVTKMETDLQNSNKSIAILHTALVKSSAEVKRLNASVAHWKNEVKRLEVSMQAQHEADIESLNRISEMLASLADIEVTAADIEGARE